MTSQAFDDALNAVGPDITVSFSKFHGKEEILIKGTHLAFINMMIEPKPNAETGELFTTTYYTNSPLRLHAKSSNELVDMVRRVVINIREALKKPFELSRDIFRSEIPLIIICPNIYNPVTLKLFSILPVDYDGHETSDIYDVSGYAVQTIDGCMYFSNSGICNYNSVQETISCAYEYMNRKFN